MRYEHTITVPAKTIQSAPYVENAYLAIGVLERVLIRFPMGCFNQVFITVSDGLQQIVPGSPDSNINGNNQIYDIPMKHRLTSPPFSLLVAGWSTLCEFDHSITLWFDVVEGYEVDQKSMIETLTYLGGAV